MPSSDSPATVSWPLCSRANRPSPNAPVAAPNAPTVMSNQARTISPG